jgi:predicted double-glycine peptidase
MNPWIETSGVALLAIAGVVLGWSSSRLPAPYWSLGYVVPALLIGLVGLARLVPTLEFVPPFSWLTAGRAEFALSGIATTLLFTTPLSRVPTRRTRSYVIGFMIFFVGYAAITPFAIPALIHDYLAGLKTTMTVDGVCLQSNGYNCGPAAAVTALRRLGFHAEEGQIAVLAHTSSVGGTQPDSLCLALRKCYAAEGLECEYRHFNSLAELNGAGLVIAVVKYGLLVDHYVTVLALNEKEVIVGDPLQGRVICTPAEFKDRWRFSGIVVKRRP